MENKKYLYKLEGWDILNIKEINTIEKISPRQYIINMNENGNEEWYDSKPSNFTIHSDEYLKLEDFLVKEWLLHI